MDVCPWNEHLRASANTLIKVTAGFRSSPEGRIGHGHPVNRPPVHRAHLSSSFTQCPLTPRELCRDTRHQLEAAAGRTCLDPTLRNHVILSSLLPTEKMPKWHLEREQI